jgi:hypothetical protein
VPFSSLSPNPLFTVRKNANTPGPEFSPFDPNALQEATGLSWDELQNSLEHLSLEELNELVEMLTVIDNGLRLADPLLQNARQQVENVLARMNRFVEGGVDVL